MNGPDAPDASAWTIHGAIHRARPEARVLLHCHPPYTTALACLKDPTMKPIDQNTARFFGRMGVDLEFGGTLAGQGDVLSVGGAAALAGGVIHVAFVNNFVPQVNDTFTLVTAGAGAPAAAGGVTVSGVSPTFGFQLLTSGNSLVLRAATPALPVNQWNVDASSATWGAAGNWSLATAPDAPGALPVSPQRYATLSIALPIPPSR